LDRVIANSPKVLRERVRTVVKRYAQGQLVPLLDDLSGLGEVVLFGGVLRDLALRCPSSFRSDVDLVIVSAHERDFDHFFEGRPARINRFGGYRVMLPQGSVDVWPLQRTWAFRTGALSGTSPRDLLRTTYFSWDAIAYSWQTGRLFCRPSYLQEIRSRVVDLEFPDNPYPLGAVVRTLRLLASGKAGISFRLARHTRRLLDLYKIGEIVRAERRGFASHYLSKEVVARISGLLTRFLLRDAGAAAAFEIQLQLPFSKEVPIYQAAASGELRSLGSDQAQE
jgi:predicted nucleotidyltransferase